jgi:C4-dicarboxylate transporter, DctM subunit
MVSPSAVLPLLEAAGLDLICIAVIMTIVMAIGLIRPPVGPNIFVNKNVAPDIPLSQIISGTMPFPGLTFLCRAALLPLSGHHDMAAGGPS